MRHLPLPRLAVSRETLLVETGATDFAFFRAVAELIVVKTQGRIVDRFRLWGWSLFVARWTVGSTSLRPASVSASEVVPRSLVREAAINGVDFVSVI